MNVRHDFQEQTLVMLNHATREMIDQAPGIRGLSAVKGDWELIKKLVVMIEESAKNERGYLDNISMENKNILELVQRRIKLLSNELNPQPLPIRLCENKRPDADTFCILKYGHSPDVDHMNEVGQRW